VNPLVRRRKRRRPNPNKAKYQRTFKITMTAKIYCSNAEAKNLFGMKTGFLEANVEKVMNQYIYNLNGIGNQA